MEILDDPAAIKQIDRSDMLGTVGRWPEMIGEAAELAARVRLGAIIRDDFKQVLIQGMGGSGIGGDVIRSLYSPSVPVPIAVNKTYTLPAWVGRETLLFVISYSGNTEETLAAFAEGLRRGARMIAITSGGELKSRAEEKGFPVMAVPAGLQPRAALPYLLIPALIALQKLGIVSEVDREIEGIDLKPFVQRYGVASRENLANSWATKLKRPFIFATAGTTEAAGLRLKNQLNENAKTTAFLSLFPELNHNEIVNLGGERQDDLSLIIFRDGGDGSSIVKRIEVTKSLLKDKVADIFEIFSEGDSRLARLLSLIIFADYLSVYLAILRGIDPTPVAIIEELKKRLAA